VKFEIIDKSNYEFEGGKEAVNVAYNILPMPLSVVVSSVTKYLFEKEDKPTFTVKSGRVFEGDDLLISYYKNDGFIYCVSANPNYILTAVAGEVLHYSYPSLSGILIISLVFLFFLFVVTLGAILVIKAKRGYQPALKGNEKKDRQISDPVILIFSLYNGVGLWYDLAKSLFLEVQHLCRTLHPPILPNPFVLQHCCL
jgi:hypothetical protein